MRLHKVLLAGCGVLAACSSSQPERDAAEPAPGAGGSVATVPTVPTTPVELQEGDSLLRLTLKSAAFDRIHADLELASQHDTESLLSAYDVPFRSGITYDATQALGLDLIQQSALQLDAGELALLAQNGFVISRRVHYPSFPYGYFDIYGSDLPVFISADMVLEAVHRSFDSMLKAVESEFTIPTLERLLRSMRARLTSGAHNLPATAAADAAVYLDVADGLLGVDQLSANPSPTARDILQKIRAEAGSGFIDIFGTRREVDFSQFKPRGHYEDSEELKRYFRAMIWLGSLDLRFLETQPDGTQIFRRRQVEAALGLRGLLDAEALADWQAIDRTIGVFVGEHDYMIVPELDQLLAALGTTLETGLGNTSDQAIAEAIVANQFGEQRISSHIMWTDYQVDTLSLSSSFAFFGQRYTVDSHVFSNVVFDRIDLERFLPDPLDVAFSALGNNQAAALLSSELTTWEYAGALGSMRTLVDAHPAEYWQSSLYASWLSALRTLSPSGDALQAARLPEVARTESWGRRLLNTQLASWAELRHDTILYAKQSYTAGSVCEFPDGYVEPNPEFFWAIARYAERGQTAIDDIGLAQASSPLAARMSEYFTKTAEIAGRLGELAEAQRTGTPHTDEQIIFLNQIVRISGGGSGPPMATGWYRDLHFSPDEALDLDPTIADVHTDPNGPAVLHVGTGLPRAMVMTVDTCSGPRAYAGIVSAYHEHLARGFTRLADSEWQPMVVNGMPDVPWLAPVLGAP